MKGYLVKTPKLVQRIFPKRVWAFSRSEPNIYLTFDDGPIPEVTPWVLEVLKEHNAKATFFCIGDNIKKHPEVFNQIIQDGHAVGNHTFNHLKGSKTNEKAYIENTALCEDEIAKHTTLTTNLFRPPYGAIKSSQARTLQKLGYKIIMWNVLSADFDTHISEEKCLQNVLKNIETGSIVVFHDSLKTKRNLRFALPKVLSHIEEKGWKCVAIK